MKINRFVNLCSFQPLDAFVTPKPPGKVNLNVTPPAPRHKGDIQYLDLDTEHDTTHGQPSNSNRSPPNVTGGLSPTDYKEIDFLKTDALSKTIKDRQNVKRGSSEKSIDE